MRLARPKTAGRLEKGRFVVPTNSALAENMVPARERRCCLFGVLAGRKNFREGTLSANYKTRTCVWQANPYAALRR